MSAPVEIYIYMRPRVRRARPGEAELLTGIAHAAKRHWQYPERLIQLWSDLLTITPDFIRNHPTYVLQQNDQVIGFYSLVGTGPEPRLEHLWVLPSHIGQGFGRILFEHAITRAASSRAESILIESDPNVEGFYIRMGAARLGERVMTLDGAPRLLPLLRFDIVTGGGGGSGASHQPAPYFVAIRVGSTSAQTSVHKVCLPRCGGNRLEEDYET